MDNIFFLVIFSHMARCSHVRISLEKINAIEIAQFQSMDISNYTRYC